MQELYELKKRLMDELKEYGSKDMSAGTLDVVDKLTHAIKNLCKVIEADEEGESEGSYRRGSYDRGTSGRRGRMRATRDSRGRYMSSGYYEAQEDAMSTLRDLMESEQDEGNRQEIQRFMQKLERMK